MCWESIYYVDIVYWYWYVDDLCFHVNLKQPLRHKLFDLSETAIQTCFITLTQRDVLLFTFIVENLITIIIVKRFISYKSDDRLLPVYMNKIN